MNGFRRKYEYEEDIGVAGFLLVFFVMLVVAEVLFGIITTSQVRSSLFSTPAMATVFTIVGIVYIAFISLTCVALFKIRRHAVKITKIYLVTRAIFLTICTIITFNDAYHDPLAIGPAPEQFHSVQDLVSACLITPLVYVIAFSSVWFAYFVKSKRVKSYYRTHV